MRVRHLLPLLALVAVVGCSSGGGDGCDTDNGTPLSMSAWPKFRRDLANTGRTDAVIAATTHAEKWVFPPRPAAPFANAATSPVILVDDEGTTDPLDDRIKIVVVAGQPEFPTTNRVYLIHPATGAEDGSFNAQLNSTASVSPGSTPVISLSRIGVMFTDASLRQFDFKGNFINSLSANGSVIGSLTIDDEGTIYTAAANGVYSSLCASGGARYIATIGGSESSPALYEGEDPLTTDDDVSVIAGNDGKVRAINLDGDLLWTFTATSAVRASVIYDADNKLVYGADSSGLVFAIDAVDGRRCRNLSFKIGGQLDVPVVASPAFADNVLYVIDTAGVLHALAIEAPCDTASAAPSASMVERWVYPSGASVSSSPALASLPDGQPVVVFGSDDGTVHAVVAPAQGNTGTAVWTHCTQERGAFGRSSAAIGADGTVYVTTAAGRLYALSAGEDAAIPCSMLEDATPTAVPDATPTASPSVSASPSPTATAGS